MRRWSAATCRCSSRNDLPARPSAEVLIIDDLVDTYWGDGVAVRDMLADAHFATVYASLQPSPTEVSFVTEVRRPGSSFPGTRDCRSRAPIGKPDAKPRRRA
ncbi:MAG: hypothetical protein U1E25_12345 [Methylocystis sp.]